MNEVEKIGYHMAKAKVKLLQARRALVQLREFHAEQIDGCQKQIKKNEELVAEAEEILKIMLEAGIPYVQAAMLAKVSK